MNDRALAIGQGVYFAATGVWPLVHMASFEAVTGPKVDTWLVRTVGVLVASVGATLISAGVHGAIDAFYATRKRISKIYLAEAAVEAAVVMAWSAGAFAGRR